MHHNRNDRQLTRPDGLTLFARPAAAAIEALSHCLNAWRSPATVASSSGDRIVCLIVALLLLPASTAAGQAQPPSALAETSAPPTLAPLVRKAIPSVVSITVRASAPVQEPIFVDPESGFPDAPYRSTDRVINAAGVVVDARGGLIVTSAHVVEHANDISVALSDGRRFQGSHVDTDPNTDIAVIRIDATDLVELPMANSDTLEVGDYLIAIGNPFGKGTTITHGIVSALHRSDLHFSGYQDFIQTDASLNPGSSGGPIVNLRGELVGIAAAITSPTGSNIGIGFAVPVNKVRELVDRAVKYGEMRSAKHASNSAASDRTLFEPPTSPAR
jgi:S1-C subfamily serine protease